MPVMNRRDDEKNKIEQFTALQGLSLKELQEKAQAAGVEIDDSADQAAIITKLIEAGFNDEASTLATDDDGSIKAGIAFALKVADKTTNQTEWEEDNNFMQLARQRIQKNKFGKLTLETLQQNRDGNFYTRTLPHVEVTQDATRQRILKMIVRLKDERMEKMLADFEKNPKKYEQHLVLVSRTEYDENGARVERERTGFRPGQERDASIPLQNYVMFYIREIQKNVKPETM